MIFLEINEFSPELMKLAAEKLNAPNLKKLLALNHTETTTDDKAERFGLDPWVQWVSIHTGKTSSEHGVSHLGDVPQLNDPQIWETLDKRGVKTGIWGAMNASRNQTTECQFFFPDPWTFSEDAHPPELNNLLAFPRYFSKNYCELNRVKALKTFLKLVWFGLNPRITATLLPIIPKLISTIYKYGLPEYLLFSLFDLVNAKLFAHYFKYKKPDFSILFLNSLAHLQHHKWTNEERLSDEMKIAFSLFDDALGEIFKVVPPDQPLLIANAFSQFCSYNQNEYLYRQKNPEKFLIESDIAFNRIEQAMTNDGHVFFDNVLQAECAAEILQTATVNGKPAFHVEMDQKNRNKLFYQFILWDLLPENSLLLINKKQFSFFDQFEQITRRSGCHLQKGDIFSKGIQFPEKIYNHEIHDYILESFA